MGRHIFGLVRLQVADEMPFDAGGDVGQVGLLAHRFLHVVLAERSLPGCVHGADLLAGTHLADCQQHDIALAAPLRGGNQAGSQFEQSCGGFVQGRVPKQADVVILPAGGRGGAVKRGN